MATKTPEREPADWIVMVDDVWTNPDQLASQAASRTHCELQNRQCAVAITQLSRFESSAFFNLRNHECSFLRSSDQEWFAFRGDIYQKTALSMAADEEKHWGYVFRREVEVHVLGGTPLHHWPYNPKDLGQIT